MMPNLDGTIKRLQDSLKVMNRWCRTDSLDDPIANIERAMEDALELLKTMEVVVKCKDCICCIPYNDRWRLPSKPDGLWCRLFDKEVEKEWYCHEGQGW